MLPPEPVAGQVKPVSELITGLIDASVRVADYFDRFDWDAAAPDAGELSAEDFLNALTG